MMVARLCRKAFSARPLVAAAAATRRSAAGPVRAFAQQTSEQSVRASGSSQRGKNFLAFWSTPLGKRLVFIGTGLAMAGALIAYISPHTYLKSWIRKEFQHSRNGRRTMLTLAFGSIVDEVVQDMGLSQEESKLVKIFVINMPDAYTWGRLSSGTLIGIPSYFLNVESVDVSLGSMIIRDRKLTTEEIGSESAGQFARSLVLSENAKKFAIAREIERSRSRPLYVYKGAMASTLVFACYVTTRYLNRKFNLLQKLPLYPRLMIYGATMSFYALIHLQLADLISRAEEVSIDEKACSLGKQYAEGGVEFYSKFLDRNVALRKLLGDPLGPLSYNSKGEVVQGFIRTRSAPLAKRQAKCQEVLSSL